MVKHNKIGFITVKMQITGMKPPKERRRKEKKTQSLWERRKGKCGQRKRTGGLTICTTTTSRNPRVRRSWLTRTGTTLGTRKLLPKPGDAEDMGMFYSHKLFALNFTNELINLNRIISKFMKVAGIEMFFLQCLKWLNSWRGTGL